MHPLQGVSNRAQRPNTRNVSGGVTVTLRVYRRVNRPQSAINMHRTNHFRPRQVCTIRRAAPYVISPHRRYQVLGSRRHNFRANGIRHLTHQRRHSNTDDGYQTRQHRQGIRATIMARLNISLIKSSPNILLRARVHRNLRLFTVGRLTRQIIQVTRRRDTTAVR